MTKITDVERKEIKRVLAKFNSDSRKSKKEIFYDLCFCICAPQTTFANNCKVQKALRKANFYKNDIPLDKFHEMLRPARFYRQKAQRLLEAREMFNGFLYKAIKSQLDKTTPTQLSDSDFRDAIEANVKGLGMKAASHFCRNLGCTDIAIIDTHIWKFMDLDISAVSSKKKYRIVEKDFKEIAKKYKLSPVGLDAWVWKKYSDTPWDDFIY